MNKESIRVLVVDDEMFSQQLLSLILEKQNFTVLCAQSGEEAVALAAQEQPDLILLDVLMPVADGFATCERLKQLPATADIPVIFISGLDDLRSKVRCLTSGGWDFITKPFQPMEVEARVKNCLKLRLACQQLLEAQARQLQQGHDAQLPLPVKPAELPEAGFIMHHLPGQQEGGDFYDVFPIATGIFGYLVASLASQGSGATFTTSSLKALVRQNSSILSTPTETVRTINRILASICLEGQQLTAVYATLNRAHHTLTVVNAGHLPMLYLPLQGEPEWVASNSDILGVSRDATYASQTLKVAPGDRFYLFSAGLAVSFAPPSAREQVLSELAAIAKEKQPDPMPQSTEAMLKALWPAGRQPEGDIVLLAVTV